MATITAFKFDTPDGAGQMLELVRQLASGQLIALEDAAMVIWSQGERKPRIRHVYDRTGAGALGGAFCGMLFGMLFFVPFFGMAVGAAMGGLSGHFSDYGIDDGFIKSVRDQVTEGASALFLLTGNVTVDKVQQELKGQMGSLIRSNLSNEQEARLRETFGEE